MSAFGGGQQYLAQRGMDVHHVAQLLHPDAVFVAIEYDDDGYVKTYTFEEF